jgi:aryl-alcohol dehydrogenase-like predicted oxidoreductase
MIPDHHTLAGSDIAVPALGVGTWAWGDRSTWGMGGYDTDLTRETIAEAWTASIDAGVTLFDTAEVYGGGESERILGSLLAADPGRAASVVVATKFMPSPWKLQVRGSLLASLRASLDRLGLASTRFTVPSASVPTRPWPTRWPPPTRPGWCRPWGSPTTP